MNITFPEPILQIEFANALARFRAIYLQNALLATVRDINIVDLDKQLSEFVSRGDLAAMAQFGLRAELLFAVPIILEANPRLLGYYRLLMGFSQKEFYGIDKGFGVGSFKTMESKGVLSKKSLTHLPKLCMAFCSTASQLLKGIGALLLNRDLFDDLTLLTIGPQLRGSKNNQVGSAGIVKVFDIIREIVAHSSPVVNQSSIALISATGRRIRIEFAADPDIIIREEMAPKHYRNVLAIEVKSGTDISNIHNRIGEAEKSHQKARQNGYTECWTVVNVRVDSKLAKRESPSTDRFYSLATLALRSGNEYDDFRRRLIALTAIPEPK